ncbi:MAG: alpha-L-fucosidase [Clostridia bacterium]|nr:alpha-L-fucosidase [Clostridia bacterium]
MTRSIPSILRTVFLFFTAVCLLTAFALVSHAENAKTDYDFSGVYLTRDSISLKVGGSTTLTTRKIGISGTPAFSSSDPDIATVSSKGVVKAVALGETTVTVTLGESRDTVKVRVTELDPSHEAYTHTSELLRDFLDMRFGMFLHFNSSTYEFANIGGDWAGENRTSTFDPKSWNPSSMDCVEWARSAKSAGMTFAVLTTKHHDGFDLWDSAYTDYDIGSATYQNDVIKEFTDACRAEGIKPGLYFSMLDIKHKITSSSCTPTDIEFIKAQLTELLTNYGEIPFIIFDAWNAWWGGPNYSMLPYDEIVNLVHTLQPNCLVINISCEANNVRSEVAMFESAAGQNVPAWFDNLNISCNTPSSHWFWCTKYNNETFKSADWVLDSLNTFRDSDTVFILNVSPNQKGVLIPKYNTLLKEIGARYGKQEDVSEYPARYIADYDYTKNLLFRKTMWAATQDGNACPDRAVDGFCDFDVTHETAYQSPTGSAVILGDIGYTTSLGKCYLHLSSLMKDSDLEKAYLFVMNEDPGARTTYSKLNRSEYLVKIRLSDCPKNENLVTVDLSTLEGRYLAVALESSGTLSFSEIVLTPKDCTDAGAYSLRERFSTVSHTVNSELLLPEEAIFVTEAGALVKETVTWQTEGLDLNKTGMITVKGKSASGCAVRIKVRIMAAGSFREVASAGVTASSMWSQAEQLGWAHSRNLIDKSGLTLNPTNILYSGHDNPYNGTSMWHTLEGQRTGWLIFDFGKSVNLTNAAIWNHNQLNEPDRGVKRMAVYYTDKANPTAADWILVDNYQLTSAGAVADQKATDIISFGKITARKIKFELLENYGDPSVVGLSEVIFLEDTLASSLDTVKASAAISEFEMLNAFDYPTSSYSDTKTAYTALKNGIVTVKTQEALDTLTKALTDSLATLKKSFKQKTPKELSSYLFRVKKNGALPESVTVSFTDGSKTTVKVLWDAIPSDKLSTVGCFLASGMLEDTTYTVKASIIVEGISKDSLDTVVKAYETVDAARYTKESMQKLTEALAKAKAVLANADATQEEIDAAKSTLTAARYSLVIEYSSEPPVPPVTEAPNTSDKTPVTTVPAPVTDTPTTTDTPTPSAPASPSRTLLFVTLGILLLVGGAVAIWFFMKKKG